MQKLYLCVGSAGLWFTHTHTHTLQYFKCFLKITKVRKLYSEVSVSNIYMFLQKQREEYWDGHIDANKHLGPDQTVGCWKVLAIKEYAHRSGQKREEHTFHRKRCDGRWSGSQQAKDGVVSFSKQFSMFLRDVCLSGQIVDMRCKARATKLRKVVKLWLMEGNFTPLYHTVQYSTTACNREALLLSPIK